MKTLVLAASSAVVLLASGCVIDGDDDRHHRGDIGPLPTDQFDLIFAITLDGATCAQVPEVDRVWIRMEGPRVADETVLCPPEGGRIFEDLPRGTYTWRIDGLGVDDTILYSATGIVDLDRDLTVPADLVPIGGPVEETGVLTFFWTFGGGNCATAGVSEVRVTIPGQFDDTVPCASDGVEGIAIENLAPGTTTWTLTGLAADLTTELYEANGTNTVPAGDELQITVDLAAIDAV